MIRAGTPLLNRLFFHHPQAAYPVIAGFLFGFPIGSKTTADLLRQGKLTLKEANILCAMCNNISPVFVSTYLLASSLNLYHKTWVTYAVLYLPPLLSGLFLLWRQKACSSAKPAATNSNLSFQMIDAGIMDGFETLLKLGGYIMLFSLLTRMCMRIANGHELALMCLTGLTEITNGIHMIAQSPSYPLTIKYPMAIGITALGGLSGFAQTASMTKGTGISMRFYFLFRIVQAAVSTGLAALFF